MFTLRYTGPSVRERHFNQTLHLNCRLSETFSLFGYPCQDLIPDKITLINSFSVPSLNESHYLTTTQQSREQPAISIPCPTMFPDREKTVDNAVFFQLVKSPSHCLSCGTSLKRLSLTLNQFGALQLKNHVVPTLLLPWGPVSIVLLSNKKIG